MGSNVAFLVSEVSRPVTDPCVQQYRWNSTALPLASAKCQHPTPKACLTFNSRLYGDYLFLRGPEQLADVRHRTHQAVMSACQPCVPLVFSNELPVHVTV
jgi:hypothetical protein